MADSFYYGQRDYIEQLNGLANLVEQIYGGMNLLPPVAKSGAYTDLTGKPTFSTVAFSGSYLDLSNLPSIPIKLSQLANDTGFVNATQAAASAPVQSVAGREGIITLTSADVGLNNVENKSSTQILAQMTSGNVTAALGYTPINVARIGAVNGVAALDSSGKVPSSQLPTSSVGVSSVVGRTGDVVLTSADVGLGNVSNQTPTQILAGLTSANVTSALGYTPINPSAEGVANGVATLGSDGKLTAAQLPTVTTSVNTRTGAVTLTSTDVGLGNVANQSPTQILAGLTSSNVTTALNYTPANLVSPTFTGTPLVPTATAGTNTTQAASTAFVMNAVNNQALGTLTDVSVSSPTNGQQLTYNGTAWVNQTPAMMVNTFNTRSGTVTLTSGDVTTALGFTPVNTSVLGAANGVATLGADGKLTTAQISSYVVTSFNTRYGAITLTSGDVTTALTYTPANKAGDTFSGAVTINSTLTATGQTSLGGTSGAESLRANVVTSAVNRVEVNGATTTNPVKIAAAGSDTNISLKLTPKGTGLVSIDGNYAEKVNAMGSISGSQSIDLSFGSYVTCTITANTTFSFTNPVASGTLCSFTLEIVNGGAYTISWPTAASWVLGAVPTLATSGTNFITFYTHDGGTTWWSLFIH